MFGVMLYSRWKWPRLIVLLGGVGGLALPLISVHGAARADSSPLQAPELLHAVQSWGVLYPVLAATLGLLVAMASWTPDHRGRHVYALVLPVPRWRYVLLRFGAGALLLAAPITAVLVGALLATMSAAIPAGLQGYPVALAVRFALAVLVAFAVFFAVSAGTAPTPGVLLSLIGGGMLAPGITNVAMAHPRPPGKLQLVGLHWPRPPALL